jgi:vancomycin resistance protein VanJ
VVPWSWFAIRDLDPVFDAVAVAFPVVVLAVASVLGLVAVAARRPAPALALVSWLAVGALVVIGPWLPVDGRAPTAGMRIVEANVLGDSSGGRAVADILAQHPDLVVVTELGRLVDAALRDEYEAAARSPVLPGAFEGDVGLYSRWPMEPGPLPDALADQRGLRAVVAGPNGDFVVYALHLAKPTLNPSSSIELGFRADRRLIDEVRKAVRAELLPTLVVGDLNLVDRTSGYRSLRADLDDAMRADWVGPTSYRTWTVPLIARIDHVFMPKSWCSSNAKTFTLPRSDHRGVAVTLGPC